MILVLKKDTTPRQEAQLLAYLEQLGLAVTREACEGSAVWLLSGGAERVDSGLLSSLPMVESVLPTADPLPLASRRSHPADTVVQVGEIPVAPYCPLGTWELADTVAGYCLDYNAVLLCNHGVVTWGSSLREAYYRAEAVESYFHIFSLYCQNQGRGNLLTPEQVSQLAQVRRGRGNLKGGE